MSFADELTKIYNESVPNLDEEFSGEDIAESAEAESLNQPEMPAFDLEAREYLDKLAGAFVEAIKDIMRNRAKEGDCYTNYSFSKKKQIYSVIKYCVEPQVVLERCDLDKKERVYMLLAVEDVIIDYVVFFYSKEEKKYFTSKVKTLCKAEGISAHGHVEAQNPDSRRFANCTAYTIALK